MKLPTPFDFSGIDCNQTYGQHTQRALFAALLSYIGVAGDETESELINKALDLETPMQIVTCHEPIRPLNMDDWTVCSVLDEIEHAALNDAVYHCKLNYNISGVHDPREFRVKIPERDLIYTACDGIKYRIRAIFEYMAEAHRSDKSNRIAIITKVDDADPECAYITCLANPYLDTYRIANDDYIWNIDGITTPTYEDHMIRHTKDIVNNIDYYDTNIVLAWMQINQMLNNPNIKQASSEDKSSVSANRVTATASNTNRPIISVRYISDGTKNTRETFTRRTDAWYRRGHYRTLKNGKRIYVKGCVCGPNKGSMTMKERIIKEE